MTPYNEMIQLILDTFKNMRASNCFFPWMQLSTMVKWLTDQLDKLSKDEANERKQAAAKRVKEVILTEYRESSAYKLPTKNKFMDSIIENLERALS